MQPIRQCPYSILVMTNSKGNQAIMAASSLYREKSKKGKYLYRKVKIKMRGLLSVDASFSEDFDIPWFHKNKSKMFRQLLLGLDARA